MQRNKREREVGLKNGRDGEFGMYFMKIYSLLFDDNDDIS